jgi:molecular chaperone GrpE
VNNHDEPPVTEAPEEAVSEGDVSNPEKLAEALEEARKKVTENWELFLRARADGDNLRRRAVMDVESAHKYGIEKFAREMLAVVDSLDHGLSLASKSEGDKALREGIELTHKLLIDILDKFGIKKLDPVGESFDPMRHEALSAQPNNEVEANKVLMVVQKGFTLHDRLLRPARVIVSKAADT